MIYGCHNNPSLEYINDSLDDVLAKNERLCRGINEIWY